MLYFNFVCIQLILFNELVDGVLYSFLRLDYFLHEHFRPVFGVVALSDDAVVGSVVDALDTSGYELLLSL